MAYPMTFKVPTRHLFAYMVPEVTPKRFGVHGWPHTKKLLIIIFSPYRIITNVNNSGFAQDMIKRPKTPVSTAIIIARAMKKRNEDSSLTRCQLSLKGIGQVANLEVVDIHFITALCSALSARGICMFQISSTSYGLIMMESASGFRKVSGDQILSLGQKETQN